MMEKGTADITTMIIDVVTTKGMTMIKAITVNMIVVTMIDATMIAITVATAIATTTTTDASACEPTTGTTSFAW
jgi:hypothetical protein